MPTIRLLNKILEGRSTLEKWSTICLYLRATSNKVWNSPVIVFYSSSEALLKIAWTEARIKATLRGAKSKHTDNKSHKTFWRCVLLVIRCMVLQILELQRILDADLMKLCKSRILFSQSSNIKIETDWQAWKAQNVLTNTGKIVLSNAVKNICRRSSFVISCRSSSRNHILIRWSHSRMQLLCRSLLSKSMRIVTIKVVQLVNNKETSSLLKMKMICRKISTIRDNPIQLSKQQNLNIVKINL